MKTVLFIYLVVIATLFTSNVVGFESRKEAQTYLQKYGIQQDDVDDTRFLERVKKYRDAVAVNTELFGNRVERLIEGLDLKLKDYYGMIEIEQRQHILEPLQHALQRLEIQGKLTKENVHEWFLDTIKNNNIKNTVTQYLSLEQWNQFIHDIEDTLTPPTPTPFWSSWLGSNNKNDDKQSLFRWGEKDPYHTWLEETIKPFANELTTEQVQSLQHALDEAMVHLETLNDKEEWDTFAKQVGDIVNDKLDLVLDSLQSSIIGFKIFAHDYLGLPPVSNTDNNNNDSNTSLFSLDSFFNYFNRQLDHWASIVLLQRNVEPLISTSTTKPKEKRQTFDEFWHQLEQDTYRKIGYTEKELKSIYDYLVNASAIKHASDEYHQVVQKLRQFLIQCQRQSVAQIDLQLDKLERLLHSWKKINVDQKDEL